MQVQQQKNVSLRKMNQHYLHTLRHIDTFIFDVDGVFTDNSLLATENGELWRVFNARDGYALKTAIEKKYTVAIITGGFSQSVRKRLQLFGIQHFYDKIEHKKDTLLSFLEETGISSDNCLYIGDDIPDAEAMKLCALRCAPQDAVPEILAVANYICKNKGGQGCVREVIEMVLKSQNNWHLF